ncbi:nicotinamide phosphoribosyltransferase [Pseudomonas phage psageK4]|uniref:Nicotinamide phosphoribosyltransferase n=2 Tax=Otagovirus TaxID=2560197 RepID=A0AAE8XMZ8_9CAUD|nr:nicotinamide phosphoribosyltransferase [Pseudomonas phage psageK4]YP_010766938.1 nicotinamide phosphoribosyltransferase [Pseudomonas phage psageK4e]QXV71683.1 nicotinamide phosphoribosyltransferase [Pseudomonas phage psageK4]UAW53481.1 nicotinamide phosphoribosyltransferase [Pseudomonas phage psageK4e]
MFFEMMFATDGYKLGHGPMYRRKTTRVGSNLTPRTDKIHRRSCTSFYDGKLVWVGGQAAVQELHENWEASFFKQPKAVVIAEYEEFLMGYLGRDLPTSAQMAALHDLGYLPLEFRSLPEGTLVPMGIPVLTITNTLDDFFWLVNYHETPLSCTTWKTATNATVAREYRLICEHYTKLTGCYDAFTVSVMCHDFSMRGMSGVEDAARSGVGHLTQFVGTDTLPAIRHAKKYYDATGLIGISVPATEHAVTSNNILSILAELEEGTYEFASEEQTQIFVNMMVAGEELRLIAEVMFVYDLITRIVPNGIVSNVSDTYDFWGMLTRGYPYLKAVIMRRNPLGLQPGKVVVRPDSGDPVTVICGMKPVKGEDGKAIDFESEDAAYDWLDVGDRVREQHGSDCIKIGGVFYDYSSTVYDDYTEGCGIDMDVVYPYEVVAGAIRTLYKTFGGTITSTGHKLLDSHIGLIYGDSITTKRAEEILRRLAENGYAAANVVFGVGSYTYQCVTRDVFGFAVKATHSVIDGKDVAIYKDPKTDSKKKSAKGRLHVSADVEQDGWPLYLEDNVTVERENDGDQLLTVFYRDGVFLKRVTLDEIRDRSV